MVDDTMTNDIAGVDPAGKPLAVVPGEMQPWTDGTPAFPLAGGPVLQALLEDTLPRGGSALVVGPHDAAVVGLAASLAADVTVLRRSPSDAAALSATVPANVQVVAGSLDGFLRDSSPTFDLVVAADGLDRVLSTDSPPIDWAGRLALLARTVATGGCAVLSLTNEFSVVDLLDERPAGGRHGDEEWHPIDSDRARPASLAGLRAALEAVGLPAAAAWARLGDPELVGLVDVSELDRAGADGLATDLSVVAARRTARPLLADPDESVRASARAGLLSAMGAGWLVTIGSSSPTASAYLVVDDAPGVVRVEAEPGRWQLSPTPSPAHTQPTDTQPTDSGPASSALVAADLTALPESVPTGTSVSAALFAAAEDEDVPAFRVLAERIGTWFAARPAGDVAVHTLDTLRLDGDEIVGGLSALTYSDAPAPEVALAAAWYRFQDQLVVGHRRHPWPPWTLGDNLEAIWLGMSGHEVEEVPGSPLLVQGRSLADAVADARPGSYLTHRDVRTALADADRTARDLVEARGHVFGLERTIGFRDKQLHTREERIRSLRKKVAKVERIKASKVFKATDKARRIANTARTDPRKLASRGKKRARSLVKKVIKR